MNLILRLARALGLLPAHHSVTLPDVTRIEQMRALLWDAKPKLRVRYDKADPQKWGGR